MSELKERAGVGVGSEMEVKTEERKCPACGKPWKKLEPTLAAVRKAVEEEVCKFEAEVHKLDPNAEVGYTGSVARGRVGHDKMPADKRKPHHGLEPDVRGECGTKYDIDGFIISAKLCRKVRKIGSKRWAFAYKSTRGLEGGIRKALKARPELAHMQGGKDGFSIVIYHPEEKERLIAEDARFLILKA